MTLPEAKVCLQLLAAMHHQGEPSSNACGYFAREDDVTEKILYCRHGNISHHMSTVAEFVNHIKKEEKS